MIKKAKRSDIDNIIHLHLETFGKNHFSTTFTGKMLKRYFELLLAMNEFNFVFYSDDGHALLGYVIAGFNSQHAISQFTKEKFWLLILTLIKNPKFISEKLIELINRDSRKVKCRLYLIGIDNNSKGKGIGRELVNHLETELIKNGINEYGLSVRKDNTEAIGFYNKCGYSVEYENAKSIFYVKKI